MTWLGEFDVASLGEVLRGQGLPDLHAAKLLRDFHRRAGEIDFGRLNIGTRVRQIVELFLSGRPGAVSARTRSADGTLKLLIGFADGRAVESVLMPGYRPGRAPGTGTSRSTLFSVAAAY